MADSYYRHLESASGTTEASPYAVKIAGHITGLRVWLMLHLLGWADGEVGEDDNLAGVPEDLSSLIIDYPLAGLIDGTTRGADQERRLQRILQVARLGWG